MNGGHLTGILARAGDSQCTSHACKHVCMTAYDLPRYCTETGAADTRLLAQPCPDHTGVGSTLAGQRCSDDRLFSPLYSRDARVVPRGISSLSLISSLITLACMCVRACGPLPLYTCSLPGCCLPRMLAKAERFKEAGNDALKRGNVLEAITCYSSGLDCAPKHHILLANRAAAYAKAGRSSNLR